MKAITTESSKHKSNIKHAISGAISKREQKRFWQHVDDRMYRRFPNK